MDLNSFNHNKQNLLHDLTANENPSRQSDLNLLIQILESYTFDNRLSMKGTLSRTPVDSLDLPYALGEKVIQFDKAIY
jgi:predicted nucleotidyltransferase